MKCKVGLMANRSRECGFVELIFKRRKSSAVLVRLGEQLVLMTASANAFRILRRRQMNNAQQTKVDLAIIV